MEDATAIVPDLMDLLLAFRPGEWIIPEALTKSLTPLWDHARSEWWRLDLGSDVERMGAMGCCEGGNDPPRVSCRGRPAEGVGQETGRGLVGVGGANAVSGTSSLRRDGAGLDGVAGNAHAVTGNCRFHYAAVCDGHGGDDVARLVAANLHLHVRRAFEQWMSKRRNGSLAPAGGLEAVANAVRLAFQTMDEDLMGQECVGSTAVVALVSESILCLANCGDSRAVLSRGGAAYRLTRDHKPDLEDEQERIRRCGGEVVHFNGPRVMGQLSMSRALGDHFLREAGVISDPEVTVIGRDQRDELLVLASDGLWDVMSDEEASTLARKCLRRSKERETAPETAVRVAAKVLIRTAIDRGCRDNITVTVIDLSCGG
ncbi:unnamed protein product [Ostreobium quekettii]|uniref:protein-serine/threonine phosphatase n=1 Tax=Ostreobium quekettii TaxID=121088 RepID=A0A8S1J537_9CHLO|nr:unnamed protein product [Ostreobium quekettii]